MPVSSIIFYLLSAFTLFSAIMAVTTPKIFRSAIWLLFSLIGVAGIYFWMQIEFIAAVQVIVYVGGIVVLIIFSIFLTRQSGAELPAPVMKKIIFSLLAVVSGLALTYNLIFNHGFPASPSAPFNPGVAEIGDQMLSPQQYGYVLPFEVVSMLLLAAMVGCIVIAMKSPAEKKKENEERSFIPGIIIKKIAAKEEKEEVK